MHGYRADWEPAATSGKCMAGVPGVFWRCSAVLWGPSIHNPTRISGKTLILKNWPIFPICMEKRVGSAPSDQGRLWQPNGPECAKSHATSQSPSSRTEKLRTFSKKYFFVFRPFSGPTGLIFAVSALPAMFCSWNTFWRFWPHQEG